ncbi:hypothetical protein K1719_029557 [Acacia pycnantha]|nr:hypothetical protein K1719_029557 [Acacia pycnantha]
MISFLRSANVGYSPCSLITQRGTAGVRRIPSLAKVKRLRFLTEMVTNKEIGAFAATRLDQGTLLKGS